MLKTDVTKYDTTVSTQSELLGEVKKVLEQEKCKDESSISLYDLLKLMRKKEKECIKLEKSLRSKILNCSCVDFSAKSMELLIKYFGEKVYFKKQDGDLIIVNRHVPYEAYSLLSEYGNEISEYYDKCIEDISYYEKYIEKMIKPVNSNFIVNISNLFNTITVSESFFSLRADAMSGYSYECNSNNIINSFRGNEDEIFKRIFVKISDCPEWTHDDLYRIRKEQLEEQEKIDYEEMKKQKRLQLFKKLNIFQKK